VLKTERKERRRGANKPKRNESLHSSPQINLLMKTIAQQLNIKEFPFEIKDKNGKEIYFETSKGCWEKREYDSNGNIIYLKYSNGFWEKTEYDSKGREIYSEDSNGFWEKTEYDSKGNQTYYENSGGHIEDNRPD
jgi:hypothetical protein